MTKYIIVRKEITESFWKIEAETYNEAVDELTLIHKEATNKDDLLPLADMVKEHEKWQVYQWIDMAPGVKKYTLKDK